VDYAITTDPIDPPPTTPCRGCGRATPTRSLFRPLRRRTAAQGLSPTSAAGDHATPQAAYDAALAVVNKRRWRVVDARAPQAGRREGHIERWHARRSWFSAMTFDPRAGGARRRAHRRALLLALGSSISRHASRVRG